MPTPLICAIGTFGVCFLLLVFNAVWMASRSMNFNFGSFDKGFVRHIILAGFTVLAAATSIIMLLVWLIKGEL